jgi:hypothetical protein
VKEVFQSLKRIIFGLCVVAFFINIGLFVFAHQFLNGSAAFELEILSIGNMMLLSFVLLREPNPK